ncbi:YfiT family bacillithiol transferase [Robertmurraya massiliosenegalensis]|uniref:YfiT family bacillithiol transferase n=1 Tax=Robertmurraya TaxID=2837507 RepID=UPI0039A430B3
MDERFPIGKFNFNEEMTAERITDCIEEIEELPRLLREVLLYVTEEQLNTPYRKGGWTVRQVVHHLADSHMNAYIRLKLALTEDKPMIKPYDQDSWAELSDSNEPIDVSLNLLESLHHRFVVLLRSLSFDELNRVFIHPELGEVSIGKNIGLYSWHGKHHLAHISSVCNQTV